MNKLFVKIQSYMNINMKENYIVIERLSFIKGIIIILNIKIISQKNLFLNLSLFRKDSMSEL